MKFKVKTKDCHLFVRARASIFEEINVTELDRFSRNYLRGFLKPNLVKKNLIEYTGPVGISLYERLKKPIGKRDFLFIIEQVVVAVQKVQIHNMDINDVILDLEYVFINEVTKEVQFIYAPLVVRRSINPSLIDFIKNIAYSAKPDDESNNNFVSRFIFFFKSMNPFDIKKIEKFVEKEDRSVVDTIKKYNAGLSGFMTNKPQHYYEHYNENKSQDEEATELLNERRYDNYAGLQDCYDEETSLLNDYSDEATALLVEEEETGLLVDNYFNPRYPTLLRVLTGESISVNKPVFRLGKDRSCVDYYVDNNIAVSRSHADIITRGNKYFVKDLNSKNLTYVNNQKLPTNIEIEIYDGDRLKLANEEFIFNL